MWSRLGLAVLLVIACLELSPAAARWPMVPHAASSRPLAVVAGDQIGPSFDCAAANSPLPRLICANTRLAFVDLIMVQAYQALRAQLDEGARAEVRTEALELHQAVLSGCGIPQIGPLTREVERAAECVETHYMRQRSVWLARLRPDAREEATRPIRRHIELQRLLQQLTYLSSTATIDGVYGPEARRAISEFQRSRGRDDTSILGDRDAAALEQVLIDKAAEEKRLREIGLKVAEDARLEALAKELEQRAFNAKWEACKAYQVSACDAALQSSNLAAWQRTNLVGWRSTAQQFAADVQACRNGSTAACEIAVKSPAASTNDQAYLAQWRDAASPWTRASKYVGDTAAAVVATVTGAPPSTLIASGIAVAFAAALVVLLIMMRKRILPAPPPPDAAADPEPPPTPMPMGDSYLARPAPPPRREARPSRPAASSGSGFGGLHSPHEAPMRPGREPKFVSGGAKGAGVAINIFFPGIGSFFVRRPITAVCQIGLQFSAALMALTGLLLPVAIIVGFGNWIWAIATAAGAPVRPIQVVIQQGSIPPSS